MIGLLEIYDEDCYNDHIKGRKPSELIAVCFVRKDKKGDMENSMRHRFLFKHA